MRRPTPTYGSLTSLLDVLLILVFASLAHATAVSSRAAVAAVSPPALPPDAGAPEPEVARSTAEERAFAAIVAEVRARAPVTVRVSSAGAVREVEEPGAAPIPVNMPLLGWVSDPDVGLDYFGDREPELRVCAVVRRLLERDDLAGELVIFELEVPLTDLPVALVRGLRRDREACQRELGLAAIVEPS